MVREYIFSFIQPTGMLVHYREPIQEEINWYRDK